MVKLLARPEREKKLSKENCQISNAGNSVSMKKHNEFLRCSTSQEREVFWGGVSHENLFCFLFFYFPIEGILSWHLDAFCKLLQAITLRVSKVDKIFSLLSNEHISLVGFCLWN